MIKAIIFDMDDTLYNERDFVVEGFKAVSNYLNEKYNLNKELLLENCKNILEQNGRGKIFNIICEEYNLDENIKELVEVYRNCIPNLKLYKDAIYILENLKGRYKLGVITDGKSSVQWNKVKALKLENYMDEIIVTDDYGKEYWKPNELCYRKIIEKFNCKCNECVYIGDNPNKDFIGAKKLGFKTIRIIRDMGDHMKTFLSKEYEADYNIKDLKQILNIIGEEKL